MEIARKLLDVADVILEDTTHSEWWWSAIYLKKADTDKYEYFFFVKPKYYLPPKKMGFSWLTTRNGKGRLVPWNTPNDILVINYLWISQSGDKLIGHTELIFEKKVQFMKTTGPHYLYYHAIFCLKWRNFFPKNVDFRFWGASATYIITLIFRFFF